MKFYLLLFALLFSCSVEASFTFSEKARLAYQQATSMQFDAARANIRDIKREEPGNNIVYLIENYIDFFTIFIDENKADFERLEKNKNYRLAKIRTGDNSSPYYLYCQAEIKLQWALVRLKFEEYFTAFGEIKSAYKLLSKNEEKFPEFIANKKSLGILHAMIGTIPDSYRWGVKLLGGMDGTIEQGSQEIQSVLAYARKHDFVFEEETMVMYAFLLLHLNNQSEAAWAKINGPQLQPQENPLACFVLANVALRTGRNDEAIRLLEQKPRGAQYHSFHFLDYMLGIAKLQRLDTDADQHLLHYVQHFHGQNYIKQAYQKLAWHELVQGNEAGYRKYIAQVEQHGYAMIEGDKTAEKEAQAGLLPHPDILRARLLFDGGYSDQAYAVMTATSRENFTERRFQLEYTYRLGRICHQLQRYKEASGYYQNTIDQGSDSGYYYACNSALQMGKIYETQQAYELARQYYKICLSLKPDDYKNGLHQQAKAGMNRVKKR